MLLAWHAETLRMAGVRLHVEWRQEVVGEQHLLSPCPWAAEWRQPLHLATSLSVSEDRAILLPLLRTAELPGTQALYLPRAPVQGYDSHWGEFPQSVDEGETEGLTGIRVLPAESF